MSDSLVDLCVACLAKNLESTDKRKLRAVPDFLVRLKIPRVEHWQTRQNPTASSDSCVHRRRGQAQRWSGKAFP